MNRIASERNRRILEQGRQLVGYFLIGYPGREECINILKKSQDLGVTIFEIGYPAKNAAFDGQVIKDAQKVIDKAVGTDMAYWAKLRETVSQPLWVMGYSGDLVDTGEYLEIAKQGYIDTLVIPDIDFEERTRIAKEVGEYGVDVMGFLNPKSTEAEKEAYFNNFSMIYYQMYAGPTGMNVEADGYADVLERAKKYNGAKVFAGFGINTPKRAKKLIEDGFFGVIIGTEMIKRLNKSEADLYNFIKEVKSAVGG